MEKQRSPQAVLLHRDTQLAAHYKVKHPALIAQQDTLVFLAFYLSELLVLDYHVPRAERLLR